MTIATVVATAAVVVVDGVEVVARRLEDHHLRSHAFKTNYSHKS